MLSPSLAPPLPFAAQPLLAIAIFLELSLPLHIAFVLIAVFILGMALRGIIFLNRRHQDMNAMASRLGLHSWPDNSLPRGLSLNGTPFFNAHKLTNILEGVLLDRTEVVVLDFHKHEAHSRWSRTIIAIKTKDHIGTPADLECRKIGQWQLIYAPVGFENSPNLLDIDRLELLVKNMVNNILH
jgi:hypothetical protein